VQAFSKDVEALNIEVICFDRPGYNQTHIETNDSLSVTIGIAKEIIDKNSWTKFEVFTVSGGTPYGISFCMRYPDLVKSIQVISGLGDLTIPSVKNFFPILSLWGLRLLPRIPGSLLKKALHLKPQKRNRFLSFFLPISAPDLEVVRNTEVTQSLNLSLNEAKEQGFLGPKQDTVTFLKNWSAGCQNLQIPIHFWHGDHDHIISYQIAENMAPLFPQSGITLMKGHGHFSLIITKMNQILNFQFE
jgi:pimeloyl-ACP methyl ester carboxylesterase